MYFPIMSVSKSWHLSEEQNYEELVVGITLPTKRFLDCPWKNTESSKMVNYDTYETPLASRYASKSASAWSDIFQSWDI